ncbi:GNAT family N-acetyltransferase [Lacrimispora sp. JR3]|uniref:GNAT family N-acetyltransferase n=1 Tax=Lacrimispora sinapis TaxID=3111456 RepID=UPI0037492674
MKIVTSRLQLRPFTEQDINDVFEYCHQKDLGEMAGWDIHKSVVHTEKILSDWITQRRKLAIVCLESGKVIGHISIEADSEEGRKDTRELGFVLNHDYHRQGIMSEAVNAVLDYLFDQGILYVWACCFQNNVASKNLIEKCGFVFQQEGTYRMEYLNRNISSYEYRLSAEQWNNKN